jgi:GMP synthase (glutamine-hydrolysing)
MRARGHSELFRGIEDRRNDQGHGLLDVWMSHGDKVTELPPGFSVIGSNASTPIAAMADEERRFYAVQFHPEVTHTLKGKEIIARFVRDICGCGRDWNMPDYVAEAVARIRSLVGSEEVILGLSGGVDSSVAAALIQRAIGEQLTCVFVDNGLLRLNEAAQVMHTFARSLGVKVVHVDATAQFLGAPAGRRRSRAEAQDHRPRVRRGVSRPRPRSSATREWLAQGTIYPDVIESAGARPARRTTSRAITTSAACPRAQPQAARTAARALQGRSARTGRRARPAARHGLSPPVSRGRPRACGFSAK